MRPTYFELWVTETELWVMETENPNSPLESPLYIRVNVDVVVRDSHVV